VTILQQLYSPNHIVKNSMSEKEKSLQRWRALIFQETPRRSVRAMLLDEVEEQESLLVSLPNELLSIIFWQIRRIEGVKGLFPCFLLSKKCLQALMDEYCWMQSCRIEFGLNEKDEETWYLTYRGNLPPHKTNQLID